MTSSDYLSKQHLDAHGLRSAYVNNDPYPHIVLDEFIKPDLLNSVESEFPDLRSLKNKIEFQNQMEIKFASKGSSELSPAAKDLIGYLNSDLFLEYLQNLTGIKETLISDPYLSGGGYHEIKSGGVLKVHADFNKHPNLDLDRRLNLLLYLNKDWESSWGGNLELYRENNLSSPVVSIEPIFNRCVIFTTTSYTYHGHPDKMTCPENRSRKSIALYYFSTGRPDEEVSDKKHNSLWKESKGEKFKSSFKSIDLKSLAKDFIPPIGIRAIKKLIRR